MANEAEQSLSSPVPALLQGSYTFKEDEVLPWRHIDNLGRGGFGSVDRVEQIHGGQILARKVLRYQPRQAKQVKAKFEEEIAHLQKLGSHRHVVQLICTYQHECDFGILMLPVAPINLYDFLRKRMSSNEEDRYLETLLQSFGCLLSGLSFIHSQGIRHKDIKPQNVLVDPQSSSKFLFTDFGLSRDFSDLSKSYTSGRPDAFSSRYCAPEVAAYTKRGRKADIFSLGCVFVEIAAVLRRTTPDGLEDYVLAKAGDENADSMSFSVHHEVVVEWIRLERQRLLLAEAMRPIFDLCECMITENPSDRPHLETLFKILMSCATPEASCLYFCESCFLKHVPSSLELTIPTPQAAREFFRLRLEKYLMDFIEHRASGEEDPHYAGEMIILWIQALDHLDPAGLSTIVKIILEAVLRECSSHPEDDTRPKAMITKCTNLCGQINTGLAPRRRGIFQSGVTLFCHEEVERVIRLDNLAEEMSDAIRYRSTQRTLCFAEILKRLYTMDLVSADPINKYIQHLVCDGRDPTYYRLKQLVTLLINLGGRIPRIIIPASSYD
ncbi:MAG: hypothetical protein M1836_006438 [Candelina mexicana]|nr:MAG: hypothetical protein M1836_006438 [Candelina mexicana]